MLPSLIRIHLVLEIYSERQDPSPFCVLLCFDEQLGKVSSPIHLISRCSIYFASYMEGEFNSNCVMISDALLLVGSGDFVAVTHHITQNIIGCVAWIIPNIT